MTHHKPPQWLSLIAALLISPLAPCAAAESGQWVAKGTQPKPLASSSPNGNASTPEATAGGQQPVIIYLPQGTPVPNSQPSWVLEGFLKAKENAAKETGTVPKSLAPVESPKPDSGATAQPETKPFQPPTVSPRIASPVPTPTLAPPIVEGKPEGGGLFRWPDGMISEYSGEADPPAVPQPKRPKALFAPRTAKAGIPPTHAQQPAIATPVPAPVVPPLASPVPQESQRSNGLVDAPHPTLMPTNRPPTRSAVVKSPPPASPQAPAETPITPSPAIVAQDRAEPHSVVVSPQPAPAEPSDAKALFPRSVISKYLPNDNSANAGSATNAKPNSRATRPWSKFLPSDPPSTARSVVRPPGPALPKVDAADLEPAVATPGAGGLTESGPAPTMPAPRSVSPKTRGKALFARTRPSPSPAVETPIVVQPAASPKPPTAMAGPSDPFSASSKLMPQVPRQARAAARQPASATESKVYSQPAVEVPREELVRTTPIPLGHPSMAEMQGSKRRVRIASPAPQPPGNVASAGPTTKRAVEKQFVEQKGTPRTWRSAMETAEVAPHEAIAKTTDKPRAEPSKVSTPTKSRPNKLVVEVVTAEPQPTVDSISRKPTIVEPEPADQSQAIVSDQATRSARGADAPRSVASPRPNPVRLREQSEPVDSVLTSAVSPREQIESEVSAREQSPVRSNPIRVTRGASRGGNNPLR